MPRQFLVTATIGQAAKRFPAIEANSVSEALAIARSRYQAQAEKELRREGSINNLQWEIEEDFL